MSRISYETDDVWEYVEFDVSTIIAAMLIACVIMLITVFSA
jgi:hypothetical protein